MQYDQMPSPIPNLVCKKRSKTVEQFAVLKTTDNWAGPGTSVTIIEATCPHCDAAIMQKLEDATSAYFQKHHEVLSNEEFIEWKLTHA